MEKKDGIQVPTMGGVKDSFKDLAIGGIGGAGLAIGYKLFGGLAFLAAPLLVGAVMKGEQGRIISTMAGVALGMALLGGLGSSGGESASSQEAVM